MPGISRSAAKVLLGIMLAGCSNSEAAKKKKVPAPEPAKQSVAAAVPAPPPPPPVLDTQRYNRLLMHMVHDTAKVHWPVKTEYPLPGALLPFNRIIAY